MKKQVTNPIAKLAVILAASLALTAGCVAGDQAATKKAEPQEAAPAAQAQEQDNGLTTAPEPGASEDLYAKEPPQLKPYQCAQCHRMQYLFLKHSDSKHKFDCKRCHTKFHAYSPIKKNWEEIMPSCSTCHTPPPHGEELTNCKKCHFNPHSPLTINMNDNLLTSCDKCHQGPPQQLKEFKSAHTEQGCDACHTKHGEIPTCSNCHEGHFEGQDFATCGSCHPAHAPKEIKFGDDDYSRTCSSCHEEVYGKWSHTKSKHGQVRCTDCHERHGEIPQCQRCHGLPHGEKLLQKYPRCLDCHIDVHDLPAKS